MQRTFLTSLMLLLAAGQLQAGQVGAQQEVSTSQYLTIIVDSLKQVHDALSAINQTADSRSTLTAKMTANKNGIVELNMAIQRLAEAASVKNDNGKEALKMIGTGYLWILRSLGIQKQADERWESAVWLMLDNSTKIEGVAGIRSMTSDAASLYQQSTKLLMDAAKLAFLSTIVADPKDANKTVVNLSTEERAALVTKLESDFGPGIKDVKSTDTGPMVAAGLIYTGASLMRTIR